MTGLLLSGGTVLDGTGRPAVRADVWVRDGVVSAIGPDLGQQADASTSRRDITGCVVCPGFVDIHTHSDLTLLANPHAPSKIAQGVTTEVVGNCGLGVAPLPPGADRAAIRSAVSYLDLDPEISWDWNDFGGYLDRLAGTRTSVNVAALVPHLVIHGAVCGFGDRPVTADQTEQICRLLGEALDAGAVGVSTGLVYAPLTFVQRAELVALARVTAERGKVFAWHVRSYDDGLVPSVRLAVEIARETGCATQISHLQAVGRRNWGAVQPALALVEQARADGFAVAVDCYPYLHGNAPLAQLLPPWAQDGGLETARHRLRRPEVRSAVRAAWRDRPTGWDDIAISWVADDAYADMVGHTVADLAAASGRGGDEIALDLLAALGTGVLMVAGGRSDADLRAVLAHPATVIASDGLSLDPAGITGAGMPHPRSYGCFPRYLSRYAPDDELAEAVARCTSRPAALLGLDRGVLRVGAAADLVVFEPGRLTDRATFEDPQQFPDGISLVLVGGQPVIEDGRHTGRRPGVVLGRADPERTGQSRGEEV